MKGIPRPRRARDVSNDAERACLLDIIKATLWSGTVFAHVGGDYEPDSLVANFVARDLYHLGLRIFYD